MHIDALFGLEQIGKYQFVKKKQVFIIWTSWWYLWNLWNNVFVILNYNRALCIAWMVWMNRRLMSEWWRITGSKLGQNFRLCMNEWTLCDNSNICDKTLDFVIIYNFSRHVIHWFIVRKPSILWNKTFLPMLVLLIGISYYSFTRNKCFFLKKKMR